MHGEQRGGEPGRPVRQQTAGDAIHEDRDGDVQQDVHRVEDHRPPGAQRRLELEREHRERTVAVAAPVVGQYDVREHRPPAVQSLSSPD